MDVRSRSHLRTSLLFALAGLAGCGGGGGGSSNPGGPSPLVPGSVSGFVRDIGTGVGVAGATVSAGDKTTTTDGRGYFTIANLPAGPVLLGVSKSGYAPAYATPRASDKPESTFVTLKAQGNPQSYSPAAARTLSQATEAGPYAVSFAAGSLDTTDSSLKVSITPVDPTKEASVLPGSLVTGDQTLLFPVTFAEFSILDSKGQRVQLKAGQSATVELPIPPALRSQYPLASKIHCYAYNPQTGAWEDFVDGTVRASSVDGSSPVLAAAIKHFSWYGGAPEGNKCVDVYGKVVSLVDGRPLGNARVEASPGGTTYTDADGNFMVTAGTGASASYVAYQTGYDIDGSLTGMPGAKYIEFGQVNEELVGLVSKPCKANAPPAAMPAAGTRGGKDNPINIKVGAISKVAYEVTATFTASGGAGGVVVSVQEGLPDAKGKLISPMPTSGSKITVSNGTTSAMLMQLAAGAYGLVSQAITITKGKTYTLAIDADGNGSIDGSGSVSIVGDLAWTLPTAGGTYPAANFTATWTDSGTTLGGPGYTAVYEVAFQGPSTGLYFGTDRSFKAFDALKGMGTPLPAGSYSGSLIGFSGFLTAASGSITQSKNITGVGLSGTAFSVTQGPSVSFKLQ